MCQNVRVTQHLCSTVNGERQRKEERQKERRGRKDKWLTWRDLRMGSWSSVCGTEREPRMDLERYRGKMFQVSSESAHSVLWPHGYDGRSSTVTEDVLYSSRRTAHASIAHAVHTATFQLVGVRWMSEGEGCLYACVYVCVTQNGNIINRL